MSLVFESVLKDKNMGYACTPAKPFKPQAVTCVAFVLLNNFSMMSFTGAVDALVTANLISDSPAFEIITVGLKNRLVMGDLGIAISADLELAQLPDRIDVLIVAGGLRVRLLSDLHLRRKLRNVAFLGTTMGSLWNGAFFLAEAQLMNDVECAVHPDGRAMMTDMFPTVRVSNRTHVIDKNRITCAGASSSLRMMLELIKVKKDASLAHAVEEILGCDQTAEVSGTSTVLVDTNPTLPQTLKLALELMQKNIEEPLSIDELADCVKISRRQLERRFCRFVGASPTRYYLELRLTRARQLILQSNRAITDIAIATGFCSLANFHMRFRAFFGVAPSSYRVTYERRRRNTP
ncbi:helix-turn-helix domain-containing protein [Pseudomonas sp. CCM 7891]|uniref:Helix-turn-helix domain-containing protein n=1 Tax=Pseudomonas karstica TaxID=1055468 RepID=A0A7X2RP51_9PSED|nr:helix-turn-helix domain-containing protein [Pseudomonas karstica]MTD17991.1 helix-turn-helix domain-containing protein [Pseudomonas karstica]